MDASLRRFPENVDTTEESTSNPSATIVRDIILLAKPLQQRHPSSFGTLKYMMDTPGEMLHNKRAMKTTHLPAVLPFAAILCVLMTSAPLLADAKEGWLTNAEEATEQASQQDRPLLLEFTGSDWCPPCKMMKAQVLDTDAFKEFATENLVLLELDFPNQKPQSDELKEQNRKLAQQYGVEGYPTFILLSSGGEELARHVGFLQGGPEAFINWIKSSL